MLQYLSFRSIKLNKTMRYNCYEFVAMVAPSGRYGCSIVKSYICINKIVLPSLSVFSPLTCAFLSFDLLTVHFKGVARMPLKSLICTRACDKGLYPIRGINQIIMMLFY